jgi:hypothetical protein
VDLRTLIMTQEITGSPMLMSRYFAMSNVTSLNN